MKNEQIKKSQNHGLFLFTVNSSNYFFVLTIQLPFHKLVVHVFFLGARPIKLRGSVLKTRYTSIKGGQTQCPN